MDLSQISQQLDPKVNSSEFLHWALMLPTFFLSYFIIYSIYRLAFRFVNRRSEKKKWLRFVSAFLSTSHWPFFVAFSLYISFLISPVPTEVKLIFNNLFGLTIILQIGLWCNTSLKYFFSELLNQNADATKITILRAVQLIARMALWAGIFLLVLDNFGVNITTLVAGLGIGGIAVALGVQKIVGDIFASLSIVMDKPFVIGDFIIVGEYKGTVEDIGIKTTRIRSLSGEKIVFSNSDLLESRINNYTQMSRRRVPMTLGITYETPREKLQKACNIIKAAIQNQSWTTIEFVHFAEFGDFSLNIKVAYWVESPDYLVFMATHEKVCFEIFQNFGVEGIEFAYPTQRQVFDPKTSQVLFNKI